jgi:hypothetical protein
MVGGPAPGGASRWHEGFGLIEVLDRNGKPLSLRELNGDRIVSRRFLNGHTKELGLVQDTLVFAYNSVDASGVFGLRCDPAQGIVELSPLAAKYDAVVVPCAKTLPGQLVLDVGQLVSYYTRTQCPAGTPAPLRATRFHRDGAKLYETVQWFSVPSGAFS